MNNVKCYCFDGVNYTPPKNKESFNLVLCVDSLSDYFILNYLLGRVVKTTTLRKNGERYKATINTETKIGFIDVLFKPELVQGMYILQPMLGNKELERLFKDYNILFIGE